jgi:hypothetical protein
MIMNAASPSGGFRCLGCQRQSSSLSGPASNAATILSVLALAAIIITIASFNGKKKPLAGRKGRR